MSKESGIWIEDIIEVNQEYWFTSGIFNGLFKYDRTNKSTVFISNIPEEDINQIRLFSSLCYYDSKIYLVPFMAKYLHVFDIKENVWNKIYINGEKTQLLNLCAQTDKYLILIHNNFEHFVIFNFISNEKTIVNIPQHIKGTTGQGIVKGEEFYIGLCDTNQILKIDISTSNVEIMDIGFKEQRFHLIADYNNRLLMKDNYGNICTSKWDFSDVEVIYKLVSCNSEFSIYDSTFLQDKLYIFSYFEPYVYAIDLKKMEQVSILRDINQKDKKYIKLARQWGFAKIINHQILFSYTGDDTTYLLEKDKYNQLFSLKYESEFKEKLIKKIVSLQKVISETSFFQLFDLIEIKDSMEISHDITAIGESAYKNIHKVKI